MRYFNIAARALNRPLLMAPDYASHFFAALGQRFGVDGLVDTSGRMIEAEGLPALAAAYGRSAGIGKLYTDDRGVAIIPIDGTLVHKSGYVGAQSGMTGYDGIASQIKAALSDKSVSGIMLDIDSPGGEVAGVADLARLISAANKPVWAHANENAASAAYWLASASNRVLLSETAAAGSVGVLLAHMDSSQALASEGRVVTLIYSGAHKVDGNPFEALPERVRASLQSEVDALRAIFAGAVAFTRGMSEHDVLATEARTYTGADAIKVGFADAVISFDSAMNEFVDFLKPAGNGVKKRGVAKMEDIDNNPAQSSIEAAVKAGAAAERERISAILKSESAKGREQTATAFALETNMTSAEAVAVLGSVPVQPKNDAASVLGKMGASQTVVPDDIGVAGAVGREPSLADNLRALKIIK